MIICNHSKGTSGRRLANRGIFGLRSRALLLCALGSFLLFGATGSFAQDLGAIARAERARKEAQKEKESESAPPKHTYTNDDLVHPKILAPDDQRRYDEARKKDPPLRKDPAPVVADALAPKETPMGDVARQYRREKEARAAQERTKYPLPVIVAPLAAPISVERRVAPPPARPTVVQRGEAARSPRSLLSSQSTQESLTRGAVMSIAPSNPLAPATPMALPKPVTNVSPAPKISPAESKRTLVPERTIRPVTVSPPVKTGSSATVIVRNGDSLWRLAREHLGRGARWPELLAKNPWIEDPDRIVAGHEIVVQTEVTISRARSVVRIQQGDSLWRIAESRLGGGAGWTCLARANPQIVDPNQIYAGNELNLPDDCGPGTRGPRNPISNK